MSVKDHNIVNDISLWFPMNVTDNNVITCYYTAIDYGKTVHSARGVLTFFWICSFGSRDNGGAVIFGMSFFTINVIRSYLDVFPEIYNACQ
ncbi:hypothetical protein V1477_000115 [Vespula maculifrons]|uniref:Uncharacterized protein n=1 Tax=Vespula maculifrons TaxID=7453 RepID=A0ABD2D3I9_VESMC